jgi:hypothetical protein
MMAGRWWRSHLRFYSISESSRRIAFCDSNRPRPDTSNTSTSTTSPHACTPDIKQRLGRVGWPLRQASPIPRDQDTMRRARHPPFLSLDMSWNRSLSKNYIRTSPLAPCVPSSSPSPQSVDGALQVHPPHMHAQLGKELPELVQLVIGTEGRGFGRGGLC